MSSNTESATVTESATEVEADPDSPEPAALGCSSCGSTAPHHVAYVREHGLCVT